MSMSKDGKPPMRKFTVPIEIEIGRPLTITMSTEIATLKNVETGELIGSVQLVMNGGLAITLNRQHPDNPKVKTVTVGVSLKGWANVIANAAFEELDKISPEQFKPYRNLEQILEDK